ncbi:MFS transporter [Hymenobacter sp. BT559]|uniref:MFS transporter n=1 Tax=Hymenobacter sp. BT559 TaxID=2795729 RepID=UPI0018EB276D|nr:MFS transporter [Hymenobacter sp. BT559]MBJ6146172.1 MFS transporter [Hymenobacter sp. BT559]
MKKIAYCCCAGIIGLLTTEFGVIGILPQLASYYHLSMAKAGWLLSAFALVIAVAGPFTTLLASGFNRKAVLLLSLAPFLLSNVVSALAPPFWLLLLVRVLPAFLQPVLYATALGLVVGGSEPEEGPRLMAIVLSGIGIATVTTIPLATYAASAWGWQAAFVVQAVVSAGALAVVYWGVPALPAQGRASYGEQLHILVKPAFLVGAAVAFLLVAGWFCTYSYFADYLGKAKGMSAAAISSLLLLFGAAGLVGNWLAGKLLSRNRRGATVVLVLGPLVVAGALAAAGTLPVPVTLAVAVWGLLYAPCFLLSSSLISAAAPEAVEFANGLAGSFTNLGVTVGTTVGGWLLLHYSLRYLPWAGAAFGLAALGVVALQSWLTTRRATVAIA